MVYVEEMLLENIINNNLINRIIDENSPERVSKIRIPRVIIFSSTNEII